MATKKKAAKPAPKTDKGQEAIAALYKVGAAINGPGSAMEKVEEVRAIINIAI